MGRLYIGLATCMLLTACGQLNGGHAVVAPATTTADVDAIPTSSSMQHAALPTMYFVDSPH